MNLERIAVIGAGSWGTALTKPLSSNVQEVLLWGHSKEHIADLRRDHENKIYLPGYVLPANVKPVADLRQAVEGCGVVLMVVPSHVFREVFQQLLPYLRNGVYIISATKGIENDSLLTMTQVMTEVLSTARDVSSTALRDVHLGVLSGPSFAKEVAAGIPTAVTVGSAEPAAARIFQQAFFTEKFRVYTSADVIGLELGGALKNIIAIAAGICDGLGYGTNTRAALITRGLAEITRLGVKMGAEPLTFSGLGGLGDLVLTCTGDLSRNRTVGLKLGQGKTLQTILGEMKMVAEGVKTTRSAWALARKAGVEMPILEQIYQVLYEDKPCSAAVSDLLARDQKEELS
jgi:glycerol-3-phosphate dehydrogenase (NAD(P)+)